MYFRPRHSAMSQAFRLTLAHHTDSPRVLNIFSKQHRPESHWSHWSHSSVKREREFPVSDLFPIPYSCSISRATLIRKSHLATALYHRTWACHHRIFATCASEHGALVRDNRVSPSASGGPPKVTAQSDHLRNQKNLVFESCEHLHVAHCPKMWYMWNKPLKWPSKSIKQKWEHLD